MKGPKSNEKGRTKYLGGGRGGGAHKRYGLEKALFVGPLVLVAFSTSPCRRAYLHGHVAPKQWTKCRREKKMKDREGIWWI